MTVRTFTFVLPVALLSVLLPGGFAASATAGFAAPAQAAPPRCDGRVATILGTPGDDTLRGTRRTDVIAGLTGNDRILGLGGDDVLCGGEGRDRIEGGPGDDRVFGQLDRRVPNRDRSSAFDMYGDRVLGGPGDDLVDPGFDTRPAVFKEADVISFEKSGRGVRVDLARGRASGQGKDRLATRGADLVTTRFADVVIGTSGRDDIGTGAGDDHVRSGGGGDFVLLDGPAVIGNGGADLARLGSGNDQSHSVAGHDIVSGQGGGDIILDRGGSGDTLGGGVGRDSIDDRFASDDEQVLIGGPERDSARDELSLTPVGSPTGSGAWDMTTGVLTVGSSAAVTSMVRGFEESILPPRIAWVVEGSRRGEGVFVFDGTADLTYHGNGGRDSFFGARGDDTFDGGAGRDYAIDMGPGQDVCIDVEKFGAGHGCETKL